MKRLPWFSILLLVAALVCAGLAWQAAMRSSVTVDWSTASEVNTAGFNLYRRGANGGEMKLNSALIPVQGDALAGATYHYNDDDARPGQSYEYWLEEVELGGATSRHGPITVQTENTFWLYAGTGVAMLGLALITWRRWRGDRI